MGHHFEHLYIIARVNQKGKLQKILKIKKYKGFLRTGAHSLRTDLWHHLLEFWQSTLIL